MKLYEVWSHFSTDGISADPRKITAIRNTTIPKDIGEFHSFLAMTNYVGRFIPDYSTITEPLRGLSKQDSKWEWTFEQQQSFDKLKNELVDDRVMSCFDPNKETKNTFTFTYIDSLLHWYPITNRLKLFSIVLRQNHQFALKDGYYVYMGTISK
ncbi:unnamed protein product [Mytilus coruscus]|uniref:Reverse transcriptase/retrotransposon-derived protein RNase H-like domain-containing protein n=1 Tax=Mytilus coruscus TaxID=42192 RepID=A0A6J8A8G3_MYTCO|nr:unnamed protein product [Mytilus coruscus]